MQTQCSCSFSLTALTANVHASNGNVNEARAEMNSTASRNNTRPAAVKSLDSFTVSMCNKLALKASQLYHLIASHLMLAVLLPNQSAYEEHHLMHLIFINMPAFALLISSICCQ